MAKTTRNMKLPTTITGSLPRPAWYTENLGARSFRDAIADARYREQYTDAVGTNVRDQERAGLDIVTDGDARFDTDVGGMSWFQYPARRFKGLAGGDYFKTRKGYGGTAKGDLIFEVMESRIMPRCVDKIERGPLHYTALWKIAQGMTGRPVKFGTITPELIGTSIGNDYYSSQEELLDDISKAMREELLELAQAGCAIIQMEEPNIHLIGIQRGSGPQFPVEFFVELFNRTVRGLRNLTEVWCHTCWGNPAQQRLFATNQSYEAALPHLNKLDVDVLTFECAGTDGMDLESIGRQITDKKIAIGVVDHRNLQVERPEQVAALVRKALKYIPLDRLILSSDCGFGREGMSRRIAFYKMVSIVRGANLIRKELGLPEAPCLAADPRYALAEEL
ncbi:MAG TPA: cobalamin-independent methionine synthase II family protein [Vicinamibacterales bacterium]|jgi:5-methyltetrahydropteroyltriglutamate--homocysteine methyltransferase